jgi:hypothetical protein
MTFTYTPFIKLAAVGITAHVIERKLERAGHGHKVIFVRMATYVSCALIAWAEWNVALRSLGHVFGIHAGW